jgi:Bifunctional DNA primase/polymerase, N-terminal
LSTLDSALELARANIPLFPVILTEDNKKVPVIEHWRNTATTNLDTIRQWFTNTSYVIGVPTGERSNIDALDIDPRHGGNVEQYHETLPDTRWHETKQGGRHYLFNRLEGMRNSTGKVETGVDVRGEGGFIVWWPAHGYACSSAPIADWPEWLSQLAMKGRARKRTGHVALDARKPPSGRHVVDLLTQMDNRLETSRDTYVDVMLAAKGCIDALIEAGELGFEDEIAIGEAAIDWANRWEAGTSTDEAAKWNDDWAHCDAPLAGWQTLIRIAADLAPSYRAKLAAEEFNAEPAPGRSYRGNPSWVSMLQLNKNGGTRNTLPNAIIPLRYAPEWQRVLTINSFTDTTDVTTPPYGGRND